MNIGEDVKDTDGWSVLTARINELYQAMLTVERYGGCSPDATEVINRLGERINTLDAMRHRRIVISPRVDAFWGKCHVCGKLISTALIAVAWYGIPKEQMADDPLPETSLIAYTHVGKCAEHYSEAEGDGCSFEELKPIESSPPV